MVKNSSVFYSLPVKVTAVILLFITACVAVSGWLAAAYMVDTGYYVEEFSVIEAQIAADRYKNLTDPVLKIRYKIEYFMYRNKVNIII